MNSLNLGKSASTTRQYYSLAQQPRVSDINSKLVKNNFITSAQQHQQQLNQQKVNF